MDASSSAPSPARQDVAAAPHASTPVKTEDRNRPIQPFPGQQAHRPGRYKDKFQVLRERYDQVNVMHVEYERVLQIASEKERKMQDEINMLLDAAMASEVAADVAPYMGTEYGPQQPYGYPDPAPHGVYPNGNGVSHPNGNGHGYAHGEPSWRVSAHAEPHGAPLEYVQVEPGRRVP
ncbi:hypothetical protein BV25DRAFT_1703866 [Artomyces pyxidatus]|uniref:Uncharacterized protein n=1 Tax=Artomyces pyxidatus TaxID=48021 RepID=A0ACB8T9K7_9AGAM|nr:hypothetical protein BV25DRAFT_1703866 [Artomyces pyxidatus]